MSSIGTNGRIKTEIDYRLKITLSTRYDGKCTCTEEVLKYKLASNENAVD